MGHKEDVRDFLISRRARVTPELAGLTYAGGDRRVPGLRRAEVADLAGISIDYYTQLEHGGIRGASDGVLDAVARALRLDDVERQHLFDLARVSTPHQSAGMRDVSSRAPSPALQRVLDNMSGPAVAYNAQQDLVGANDLGRALFALPFEAERPNLSRFIYLDPRAPNFYANWPHARRLTAAILRLEAGRAPRNAELTALITELLSLSPQFCADWAEHDVYVYRTGRKTYRHPWAGDVDVIFDRLELASEPGLSICTYTAAPSMASAQAMTVLAEWAETRHLVGSHSSDH